MTTPAEMSTIDSLLTAVQAHNRALTHLINAVEATQKQVTAVSTRLDLLRLEIEANNGTGQ